MSRVQLAKLREAELTNREEDVDASEAAQIIAIEKSFEDARAQELSQIRHPDNKRKHLRVVEVRDTWSHEITSLCERTNV